jgi:hypothetical protein
LRNDFIATETRRLMLEVAHPDTTDQQRNELLQRRRLLPFSRLPLKGGFVLMEITSANSDLVDAEGRKTNAVTRLLGNALYITVRSGLSQEEWSVAVFKEILRFATRTGSKTPPELNILDDDDFEKRAREEVYRAVGSPKPATPATVTELLERFEFRDQA